VFPRHAADLAATLEVARAHGVPLLLRGGGTSLAGQTVGEAVVVDTSRHLDRVLAIDPEARTARVEPGLVRDRLNAHLAPWGLQFTPDVSTTDRATIGGMVANDSAGTRSLKYGKTIDQVIAMTVLLADGGVAELRALDGAELAVKMTAGGVEGDAYRTVHRIVHEHEAEIRARTPKVMRRVGGYPLDALLPDRPFNLAKLLCGSEGTLAAILDVTLALHPIPRRRVLALLHFHTLIAALEAVPAIVGHGPSAVELIDRDMFALAAANPAIAAHIGWVQGDPAAVLSVEFDGDDDDELRDHLAGLAADPAAGGRAYATHLAVTPGEQREVIEFRRQGLGIYATVPGRASRSRSSRTPPSRSSTWPPTSRRCWRSAAATARRRCSTGTPRLGCSTSGRCST
jgi:FAD/FMN-containing dehydrogenase